jgi:hypothetical protein
MWSDCSTSEAANDWAIRMLLYGPAYTDVSHKCQCVQEGVKPGLSFAKKTDASSR